MIEEYAVVTTRVENLATLEIERRTACGLCGQKRGCGNATWGKLLGHKSQTISAENVIDANVGDSVVVGIDERIFLKSVFYLYIVPLLFMLLGAIFADTFFDNQLYVIVAAASGLILGFLVVKHYLVRYDKTRASPNYAVILRHADDTSECENTSGVSCKNANGHDENHEKNVVKFQTKRGE